MEQKQANQFTFGSHCAWSEGEDVAHILWRGNVSADDIKAGADIFERVPNREKGFYLVIHVAELGVLSPEARVAITKDPRSAWVRQSIVVGAPFHVRVVMGMVTKALFALRVNKAAMFFLETDADVAAHISRARG
jgi:hypothetical protein